MDRLKKRIEVQIKFELRGWTWKDFLDRLRGYTKPDLSLPAKAYLVHRYRYPHESEEEAMRGDWEKIGADFRVSIEKAERETEAK